MTDTSERSYVEAARREKRTELERLGQTAYAYGFERSHRLSEALALYDDAMGDDGPEVRVAGRIVSLRSQGKTMFCHLEDQAGRLQIYVQRDRLGEGYEAAKLLDLDDFVGVRGQLFRTRRGEVSVRADEIRLLTKSVRPLPRGKTRTTDSGEQVTYGAVQDPEFRYRQRYADLAVHPEVRKVFETRAEVWSASSVASWTSWAFSRSRRRCCSRSTAGRRRGLS
ncbi:MAG: OB-fold nucleic acid binding domain-containing protein [Gemmatimonadales bacterium]